MDPRASRAPCTAHAATAWGDVLRQVWDLEAKTVKHKLVNAHSAGGASALVFPDPKMLLSCGMDATVKLWTL